MELVRSATLSTTISHKRTYKPDEQILIAKASNISVGAQEPCTSTNPPIAKDNMLRAILLLLPALFVSALAAVPHPLSHRQDACAVDGSASGYCTPLTYADRTVASSPSSADCQQTCRGVQTDAGDWSADFAGRPAGYRDELWLGPCGFAVAREDDADTAAFEVALQNQDIVELVGEAVRRFAGRHGGKVAAEGTMRCGGRVVRWVLGE
ncbi:hypothetical protein AAE478_008941 [Parahypoxylon ruwenzoriense]